MRSEGQPASLNFCLDHGNGRTYAVPSPDGDRATFKGLLPSGNVVVLDEVCPGRADLPGTIVPTRSSRP